ncbi:condensation domain-containing protein, partial [Gilvimarinus sp. SDUM040013]
MHHIASDGWSLKILVDEFSNLYSAYVMGEESSLVPLNIQYSDYSFWQRENLQGDAINEQLRYWEKKLAGLPVVHNLPLDQVRPSQQTFQGGVHTSTLNKIQTEQLKVYCKSKNATLFMGLHCAFSILLSRFSGEKDIVVGSPTANREQPEIAGLIGFFVNMLVLRSNVSEGASFSELIEQSKALLLDAYANQQVPFEYLLESINPERSSSHSPLFQIMLVLQNNERGEVSLPNLEAERIEPPASRLAKYELTLNMMEESGAITLEWEYNTDLFSASTIETMASCFERLVHRLLEKPDGNVFELGILSERERHQQLIEWNDTRVDYPHELCIHELFEQQVA